MKIERNKKRKRFNIIKSERNLSEMMNKLPDEEVYKFISDGGFSSISFLIYVAKRTHINNFMASSFRIGKKELNMINRLFMAGKIDRCSFAVGTLMANDNENEHKYRYYENFKDLCERNGWKYYITNNHSKILLFDTIEGKFVLETSSNLNDNPKIEQFSFEKDEELFDFYKNAFERWDDS